MRIYFDNSASTKVHEEVIELVAKTMRDDYANPSAMHTMGVEAEKYVKKAAEQIADTLKVRAKEIVFTSGGTESNNLAIIGTALANKRRGKHVIIGGIEHPSVYRTAEFLKENDFEVTKLSVDNKGHILLDELKDSIRDDTILVSIMYVNNEIGSIEPVYEISKIIKEKNPEIIFHVDAVQAYAKIKINPKQLGIDLLSVSGHKFHAPKGVGFLFIDENVNIKPISFGGNQQKGMRSGTVNVYGIAGLGLASKMAYEDFDKKIEKLIEIKNFLIDELSSIEGVYLNSYKNTDSAPHIVSCSVSGVRSEVLLHTLEERDIYVSSGSACSAKKVNPHSTIRNIGTSSDLWDSTIRISLSSYSTLEEAKEFIKVFKEVVPVLRKFTAR
jgi:hypothetical protein